MDTKAAKICNAHFVDIAKAVDTAYQEDSSTNVDIYSEDADFFFLYEICSKINQAIDFLVF